MRKRYDPKAPRLAFSGTMPELESNRIYMSLRAGSKWVEAYLADNTEVVLLNPGGFPEGTGSLRRVCFLPFAEIPAPWLLFNYDPTYHTHAGALAGMRELYSDFGPESEVSVLWFTVDDDEPEMSIPFKEQRTNG